MTHEDLRELLHEQVAELETPDLAAGAWEDAVRRRRRGRLLAAGATALATVVVVAGVAVVRDRLDDDSPRVPEPAGPPPWVTQTRPASPAAADTTYQDLPVWWSPSDGQERELPWVDESPLPREIDLGPDAPAATGLDAALGVVAVFDAGLLQRIVVLAPDGSSRILDTSRLEAVHDEGGNAAALLTDDGGLSPDGRHVLFTQDSSLEVYEFATSSWRSIDTPDWAAEGARWSERGVIWVPDAVGGEGGTSYDVDGRTLGSAAADQASVLARGGEAYGPLRAAGTTVARAYRLDGPVSSDDNSELSNPEAVVLRRAGGSFVLALSGLSRAKGCCPVAGLLDERTVVFGSRGLLLAWVSGTRDVARVSAFTGVDGAETAYVASFADLSAGAS